MKQKSEATNIQNQESQTFFRSGFPETQSCVAATKWVSTVCVCPFIDESLLFEVTLWVNGRAGGRSFKPSLLKQSSLSLLISPSSTPFLAPVARPIQRIDTHWLGLEEEQDGELV